MAARWTGIWLILFALLAPAIAREQENYKRLILKDGSYELISRYEIHGDRVRYFSSERGDWEELPSSLIDWNATEEFARKEGRQADERKGEALEQAARERSEEEAHTPLAAPGVRITSPDVVYLLDVYEGRYQLNPLRQNGADLNRNTGGNILRGVINPIAGPRQKLELKDLNARVQSHVQTPSIFFPIDPTDPSLGYDSKTARNHLRLVRCEEKKDKRIVGVINIALYGKVSHKADYLDADVEPVSDYWVKVTPSAPLKPGEYALVEFDGKGAMNQFVWDFGVDPSAPPNGVAVDSSAPDKKEPVLIQKPRKNSKP